MRIVVIGATGNVGTSLLAALLRDERVESVVAVARRLPLLRLPKTAFASADVTRDDLVPHLRGADCVVHLAWLIQPSRDEATLRRTNVVGSRRVFAAVAEAGVPALVYASSIGVYSPGPKQRVDESWPHAGVPSSWYARQKAEVESELDRFEQEQPAVRVVRLRPALTMKREAAEEIRRLFFGPLLPSPLLGPGRVPLVPHVRDAVVQVVHSEDVGEAYRLAATGDARGAFNIATEPELDGRGLAAALGARTVTVPARAVRAAASLSWRARLQPTSPDWIDLALGVPLLDCGRAREELGWTPRRTAEDTVRDLFGGLASRASGQTPPLRKGARLEELRKGVGGGEL